MKGTQTSLLCLASGNIPCRGFREAIASWDGKCAESSSLLTESRGVLFRTRGQSPLCSPSQSPGTLFITLPLISPRALLTSSWAVRLYVLLLYRHQVQAVEGHHKLHLWFLSVHPLPNFTSGSLPKTSGGLWWVTFGCVDLPGAKRLVLTPVSCSRLIEATWDTILGTHWNRSLSEDFHAMRFTVHVWLQTSLARLTTNWHQILEIHHIWL